MTPLRPGTARITATAASGAKGSVRLHVRVPTDGIALNQAEMTVFTGKTASLRATVAPANAYNRRVTWTSSNPAVATVNGSGSVKGHSEGAAVITATAARDRRLSAL